MKVKPFFKFKPMDSQYALARAQEFADSCTISLRKGWFESKTKFAKRKTDVYEAAIQWKLNNIYTGWTMDYINKLHHHYHIDAPLMRELGSKLLSLTHFPLPIYERIYNLCQAMESEPEPQVQRVSYLTLQPNGIAMLPTPPDPPRKYHRSHLIRELLDSTDFIAALSLKELSAGCTYKPN